MLSQPDLDALVELYPVLCQLTGAERDALRRELQPARIPAGTVLFDLDSPCSLFLLLAAGTVRVVKPALSGREIVLYRLEPGDSCILTVSCLLGESSYPARGVAETEVAAYILTRPLFHRLLAESEPFRAFVFQRPVMLRRSVEANVRHALSTLRLPAGEVRARIASALDLTGLSDLAARPAPVLSGGEQARLALARALARQPKLLVPRRTRRQPRSRGHCRRRGDRPRSAGAGRQDRARHA